MIISPKWETNLKCAELRSQAGFKNLLPYLFLSVYFLLCPFPYDLPSITQCNGNVEFLTRWRNDNSNWRPVRLPLQLLPCSLPLAHPCLLPLALLLSASICISLLFHFFKVHRKNDTVVFQSTLESDWELKSWPYACCADLSKFLFSGFISSSLNWCYEK